MSKSSKGDVQQQSFATAILWVVLGAALSFAAVYVTLGRSDNDASVTSASTATAQEQPAPSSGSRLNTGHMTAFVFKKTPEALPAITFVDGNEQPKTLADFKGRTVLLNLWATWCAPCRKEMPQLEALQKNLGGKDFEVVALSVDRAGLPATRKFLDDIKVSALATYVDSTAKMGTVLKAVGLPTTLLIDRDGREVGRLVGPAEWDSADAKRLIEATIKAP